MQPAALASNALLFTLVACLAATVDYASLLTPEVRRRVATGLLLAMGLQCAVLPLVGFAVVSALRVHGAARLMLTVITASPGGSFSNWWCALGNGDLLTSVSATTVGTLLGAAALPLNLMLYARAAPAGADMSVDDVKWTFLFASVSTVLGGGAVGALLAVGAPCARKPCTRRALGGCANACGVSLFALSAVVSRRAPAWTLPPRTVLACGLIPLCIATIALGAASVPALRLVRPVRLAVAVECAFQNTGLALSVAMGAVAGEEASAVAASVGLLYGLVQTGLVALLVLAAWAAGWSHAPPTVGLCHALAGDFQPRETRFDEFVSRP